MMEPISADAPGAAFAPSAAQMRLAESLAFLGARTTISAILEAAEVPARTYYNWRRQPGFCRWLAGELVTQLAASAPLLLMNTMHAALAGNASARSLLFRLYIQPLWGAQIAAALAPPPAPSGRAEAEGLEAAVAAEAATAEASAPAPVLSPALPLAAPAPALAARPGTAAEAIPDRVGQAADRPRIPGPVQARARGPAPRRGWHGLAGARLPACG